MFAGTFDDGVYRTINPITNINYNIVDISDVYYLFQNHPNPFNPSTIIQYELTSRKLVVLKVYDVLGNKIVTLVNEEKQAGKYVVEFSAATLPSGIYFYKLTSGQFTSVKKMILIK